MAWGEALRRLARCRQIQCALVLLVLGESLIVVRARPFSDFYFPFCWYGLILLMDCASFLQTGRSLMRSVRTVFLVMIPLSAVFWWLFEWLNLAVDNWRYVGAGQYTGLGFAAFASMDFSTVVLAVWCTARVFYLLIPIPDRQPGKEPPPAVLLSVGVLGVVSLILAITLPRYAFGLVWVCLALMLDPVNARLGRPSILGYLWNRSWRTPLSFALAGLFCGVFWEAWNYWSLPKWIYNVPYVGFFHVFEMPLLGYSGYLPFGIEMFVMVNFALPLLGLGTIDLELKRRVSASRVPAASGHEADGAAISPRA